MIRARFKVPDTDFRPVKWPIPHPYWCTGYDFEGSAILVAYADSVEQILEFWPDAEALNSEEVDAYSFSSRFPKPTWLE